MRNVLFVTAILIGAGNSATWAAPPSKSSVELIANRDTKFSTVHSVLLAVREKFGDQTDLALSVQAPEGIAAKLRISSDIPYRQLSDALQALRRSGVSDITLVDGTTD